MATALTNNTILNEIVEEVEQLNEPEQKELLRKLRLKKYQRKKIAPVANYDSRKIKPPAIEEINKWVHEARKDPRYSK